MLGDKDHVVAADAAAMVLRSAAADLAAVERKARRRGNIP